MLDIVEAKTYGLLDMDQLEMETLVYESFADIGQPEPFDDANGNGAYDGGEHFIDVNGNGPGTPDMGAAGLGGPSDVVVYRLTYDWGIITPFMQRLLGESIRHVSSVAVRNEPFGEEEQRMRQPPRRLRRDERGVSALEFALILPILVMFSAGTIEFGRLILLTQKLQNGAFILADLTARDKTTARRSSTHLPGARPSCAPFDWRAAAAPSSTSVMGDEDEEPVIELAARRRGRARRSQHRRRHGRGAELPDELPSPGGRDHHRGGGVLRLRAALRAEHRGAHPAQLAYFKPRLGDLSTMTCCPAGAQSRRAAISHRFASALVLRSPTIASRSRSCCRRRRRRDARASARPSGDVEPVAPAVVRSSSRAPGQPLAQQVAQYGGDGRLVAAAGPRQRHRGDARIVPGKGGSTAYQPGRRLRLAGQTLVGAERHVLRHRSRKAMRSPECRRAGPLVLSRPFGGVRSPDCRVHPASPPSIYCCGAHTTCAAFPLGNLVFVKLKLPASGFLRRPAGGDRDGRAPARPSRGLSGCPRRSARPGCRSSPA